MSAPSASWPLEVTTPDTYGADPARLLMEGDEATVAQVSRWISEIVASPRFWSLRPEWRDVHQEAMTGILESLLSGRYDPGRDFRAYVRGVARNTALYTLRRNAAWRNGPAIMSWLQIARDPRDTMAKVILVRRLLDLATPRCRRLMRDYFLEDRDYGDLAREERVPEGTIKSRLSRCLDKAHALLGRTSR